MTTRRQFLGASAAAAATGIVFCDCGLPHDAHAQQLARQKLPVRIGGKRVKTIDVHAHCQFREAGALLASAVAAQAPALLVDGRPATDVAAAAYIEIDKRLAAMDAQAIDMEVLSINPFWYGSERDLAGQIVKLQNEKLSELCASVPDRFAAFASLTLQAPDLAVQELETAVMKLGLKGAAIGATVNGEAFADPRFHPVWAKAEELGVPLFIHPQGTPELAKKLAGNGWLTKARAYCHVRFPWSCRRTSSPAGTRPIAPGSRGSRPFNPGLPASRAIASSPRYRACRNTGFPSCVLTRKKISRHGDDPIDLRWRGRRHYRAFDETGKCRNDFAGLCLPRHKGVGGLRLYSRLDDNSDGALAAG